MVVEEMLKLLSAGNMAALETAWLGAVEACAPPADMAKVLEAMVAADKLDTAETMALLLLEERLGQVPPAEALAVAKAVVTAVPVSDLLRSRACEIYRELFDGHEHLESIVQASGLLGNQSPRRAFQTLDTSLAIGPEAYLANRFDQAVLRVAGYDAALGEFALVDAAGRTQHLDPRRLADEFEPVAPDDFRVLCTHRRDELTARIADDPTAILMGLCLAHGGRIDAMQLKDLLSPRHIAPDRWSRWWTRARTAAKRCPQLGLEGRNPVEVVYHPQGRSLEAELAAEADSARTAVQYLAVLRNYVRQARDRKAPPDASFVTPLIDRLAGQVVDFRAARPVDALTAAIAVAALGPLKLPAPTTACPSAEDILREASRPAEIVAGIEGVDLWPAAMEALAARPDAREQFEALIYRAPAEVLDDLAGWLVRLDGAEVIARAAATAPSKPTGNLELCLWLWKGPAEAPAGPVGKLELFSRLLGVMRDVHRDWSIQPEARKTVCRRIRQALTAKELSVYRQAVEEMDAAVADTIKRQIEQSHGLTPSLSDKMLALLREKFIELFLTAKIDPWLDESVLWTTQESLDRKHVELKDLTEVKMLANARAIGAAAAHGDLSENSEWKFAMEERDMLRGRAARLQDEISRARVLKAEDVPDETVGIGSRVCLRRLNDDAELEVTFLGPWDSDPSRRVYSYQTALAAELMGCSAGQTVALKIDGAEGEYRIERLASAIG